MNAKKLHPYFSSPEALQAFVRLRLPEEELGGSHQRTVELIAEDRIRTRGVLYTPSEGRRRVGVHIIHPRLDGSAIYAIPYLARAGYTVLGVQSRYLNDDSTCIHERLLLDVAAGVKKLKEEGCEQVVLLGISGGSSVMSFYQKQATTPPPGRLTDTPAGDPLDLNQFDLPAADGIVLFSATLGEGSSLLKWLDPSVTDELDPYSYDPKLDMFHPDNGWRLPPEPSTYSEAFVAEFRAAQIERCRRLDRIAHERIATRRARAARAAELEAAGDLGEEWRMASRQAQVTGYMHVYRTQADPALLDLSIDPDDRDYHCVPSPGSPRTDLVNWSSPVAAYLKPEAWLSTWSGLSSRAETIHNVGGYDTPLLMVHFRGDWCTRLAEIKDLFDTITSSDKELTIIRHQDHLSMPILPDCGRAPQSSEGFDAMVLWLQKRFPV